MGCPGLCILMSPLIVGAYGFVLVYFHLESCGIRVSLLFMLFLIWVWKCLVGSLVVCWNMLTFMKSWILASHCLTGKITREFPLSACAIMASLWWSLACMDLMVLVSDCVSFQFWGCYFVGGCWCARLPGFCIHLGQRGELRYRRFSFWCQVLIQSFFLGVEVVLWALL